jgi:hypothetical protein
VDKGIQDVLEERTALKKDARFGAAQAHAMPTCEHYAGDSFGAGHRRAPEITTAAAVEGSQAMSEDRWGSAKRLARNGVAIVMLTPKDRGLWNPG